MKIVKVAVAAALLASGVVHAAIYELTDVAYFYLGAFGEQPPPAGYLTRFFDLGGPIQSSMMLGSLKIESARTDWWERSPAKLVYDDSRAEVLATASATSIPFSEHGSTLTVGMLIGIGVEIQRGNVPVEGSSRPASRFVLNSISKFPHLASKCQPYPSRACRPFLEPEWHSCTDGAVESIDSSLRLRWSV